MTSKAHRYKSDALEAIHSTCVDLYEAGLLDEATMRRFDASCLLPLTKSQPSHLEARREDSEK